jgi:hypothetical protein
MTTTSKFHAGRLEFFDTATFEYMLPVAPIHFYEDFLGQSYVAVPAAGSAVDGCPFVKKIVGAGPPTLAGVANAIGGQVACTLTATSEKEDCVLYWGDNLALDCTKGLIFECRSLLSVLPSASGVQAVWGVASAWIDGPQNNTCYMEFSAQASGAVLVTAFDGVTTTSVASGVTVGTTDWHIYRIDASRLTDVAFYIDGNRVNADNSISFAATGTLAVLQPYLAAYKASGTGVATLTIDYVRAWMNRQ